MPASVSVQRSSAPAVIVMGVSAAGKSVVARALAERLGCAFTDADDLHPGANRTKIASGSPLTDADRWPWLDLVGDELERRRHVHGVVIACSALKRDYRDRLRKACPQVVFLHLEGSRTLLLQRAQERENHFMPVSLLDSQLATLEPLAAEERGTVLDLSCRIDEIVEAARAWVVVSSVA